VSECDREASTIRRPWPTGGCPTMGRSLSRIPVSWDVTLSRRASSCRRFETIRLNLQGFKVRDKPLKIKTCSFETSGTTLPATQRHVPGDRTPQLHLDQNRPGREMVTSTRYFPSSNHPRYCDIRTNYKWVSQRPVSIPFNSELTEQWDITATTVSASMGLRS
jgi:hypothetical protein